MNKKGFTLIEILSVIVILSIIMIIAVPAVSEYVANKRKESYVIAAKNNIFSVQRAITNQEIVFKEKDKVLYIPYQCIEAESGENNSPNGSFTDAFVVLTYDGFEYKYYWTSSDNSQVGIYLSELSTLDTELVKGDMKQIRTDIGIGNRRLILIMNPIECKVSTASTKEAIRQIDEGSSHDEPIVQD